MIHLAGKGAKWATGVFKTLFYLVTNNQDQPG